MGTFFGRAKKVPRPPVREPALKPRAQRTKPTSRALTKSLKTKQPIPKTADSQASCTLDPGNPCRDDGFDLANPCRDDDFD